MDSIRQLERQHAAMRRADSPQTVVVSSSPPADEFQTPRSHPCHEHPLVRVDAARVYSHCRPAGAWLCDHCRRLSSVLKQRYPWHCIYEAQTALARGSVSASPRPCQYDLCDECFYGTVHPLHQHRLRLADANKTYAAEHGIWACEYCNADRMTTKERYPYHCAECLFDLCVRCYEGVRHPLHPHRLQPARADLIYAQHGGMWFCDMCHSSRKQLREGHMWHCVRCKFDLCVSCASGIKHRLHGHKLYLADADVAYASFTGQWSCDNCQTSRRGSGQRFMRHCAECSFDLCNACFVAGVAAAATVAGVAASISPAEKHSKMLEGKEPQEDAHADSGIPRSKSGALRVGSIGHEFDDIDFESDPKKEVQMVDLSTAYQDRMASHVKEKSDGTAADAQGVSEVPAAGRSQGDGQLCLLCMDRARNATFVHGSTGHLACCMRCARSLQQRGDPCPVCRQPISAVIEQFIA